MNLVILGAPGSGKGTQAARLADRGQLRHVSTGDLLRDAVANETSLGKRVQGIMASGALVPDDVVLDLIKGVVTDHSEGDKWNGWILDGYPRTLQQAETFEDVLSSSREIIDAVIFLEGDAEVTVERLSNRRSCVKCRAVYNLLGSPPEVDGKCDACGGELVQREDDRPETIRERLKVYEKQTLPILDLYDARYDFYRVDGTKSVDDVTKEITSLIDL